MCHISGFVIATASQIFVETFQEPTWFTKTSNQFPEEIRDLVDIRYQPILRINIFLLCVIQLLTKSGLLLAMSSNNVNIYGVDFSK